jgi:flagellar assembly protein FliH
MIRVETNRFPAVDEVATPSGAVIVTEWEVGAVCLPSLDRAVFPDLDISAVPDVRDHADPERQLELDRRLAAVTSEARKHGLESGYAEGFAQGTAEGLRQGRATAESERAALVADLRAALTALAGARNELLVTLELDMAEVTLALAAELAGGAIDAEPGRVVELARQGVSLLAESDSIVLRAAPGPAALLREAQAALGEMTTTAAVRVVEDPDLETTGCVVESELARVDQRVSHRLKAARGLITKSRGEG